MLTRRRFLLGSATLAGVAGALVVGWSVLPPRQRLEPGEPLPVAPGQVALNGWVKVSSDDTVTVMMSQAEMGQGAHTGLAMLLAEEMDAAWEQIRLEQSTIDGIYNNQAAIIDALPFQPEDDGYTARGAKWLAAKAMREIPGAMATGGSSSIKDQWLPMRQAGASARAALIAAAADLWKLPAGECRAEAGRVLHASGTSASYGELAAHAASLPLPKDIVLKQPEQFKLIGKPIKRLDNAAKLDGSAIYGIDAQPEGLLYASIALCPTLGGKVRSFDGKVALAVTGVRKIVVLEPYGGGIGSVGPGTGGIAVIADMPWRAMKAVDLVDVTWDEGSAAGLSSKAVIEDLSYTLDTQAGTTYFETGDVEAALKSAAKTISAEYRVPFLAHATMEPMNCTVQFKDGAATVWAATQAPGFARRIVAKMLGIATDKVRLIVPFLGGGFGRRTFSDFLAQAVAIARETDGAPVQMIWSREQDMTHDYYRPAYVSRHKAGLDAQGRLVAWQATSAGSIMGAPSFLAGGLSKGAFDTGYAFTNARIGHQASQSAIPGGIWRSVAHSHNAFFTESFIDEAASAGGQDPVAFRAALLAGNPRLVQVLQRAADLSGWGKPLAPASDGARKARGIALHRCFGSIVAQVAEVSVGPGKQIRVHRVTCVVDCGLPVNPNLIRQQIEGGLVYGLSAALHGEITVESGQVQQSNFHDYVPLRMNECPDIETDIIVSTEEPGGIGETGTPPIAPAVANALFALTGQRLRSLPLVLA